MDLALLLAQLRAEVIDWRARSEKLAEEMREAENEASMRELMIERILATDEARAATSAPALNTNGGGMIHAGVRRPRRDIRALVKEALWSTGTFGKYSCPTDEKIALLSKDLGCRPSQIEAALRAIDKGNGPAAADRR